MKTRTKRYVVTGVITAALLGSLALPQVRAEANQFLSVFRVSQVEMVKVTPQDLNEMKSWMSENEEGTLTLEGLGKLEMSRDGQDPQFFHTAEAASEAGYTLPGFSSFNLAEMTVMPETTFTFTLDVAKANQLLAQMNVDQRFDEKLDGEPFTVSTSEAVRASYLAGNKGFTYVHTQSPSLTVPEGVDIDELKATLLSMPFIPENVKTQLASIDNLESTLPVPYLAQAGTETHEVRVNGGEGFVMESETGSTLIWKDQDQLHMITDSGMTAEELITIGENVK